MMDIKSASLSGAFNASRVRVLWQAGTLKAYDATGLVLKVRAEEPVRPSGWRRTWQVDTERGPLLVRGKCLTCGGMKWLRVLGMSGDELWNHG